MYEYNPAWSQELQEAEKRRYRAVCKVRCLTASLDRIGPEEFDQVMTQIEAAQEEVYAASAEMLQLRWNWFSNQAAAHRIAAERAEQADIARGLFIFFADL